MMIKANNLLKLYISSLLFAGSLTATPLSSQTESISENEFIVVKTKDETELAVQERKDKDYLSKRFEKISAVAKELIGTKYKPGGSNPSTGFDCSGFVGYVFKEGADIKLPRSSRDMRSVGKGVDVKSLKPGDLIFFSINTSHVGIYIGNNKFVHAPSTGRSVAIDNLMSSSFQGRVIGARRVISE